jgi:hypothetical protein
VKLEGLKVEILLIGHGRKCGEKMLGASKESGVRQAHEMDDSCQNSCVEDGFEINRECNLSWNQSKREGEKKREAIGLIKGEKNEGHNDAGGGRDGVIAKVR